MRKISVAILITALAFSTAGAQSPSKNKSVPSQKNLKNDTRKDVQIHTDQGVPFNPKGTYGAGKTAATKPEPEQASANQNSSNQKAKTTVKKKTSKTSSQKKKSVNNPGVDSKAGH